MQCDKCSARIPNDSKFCPQCGDPVTEANHVMASKPDAEVLIEITFGYSSSPSYEKAKELCKHVPSYVQSGEGRQLKHELALPVTEAELAAKIFDIVGGWKSTTMLINGYRATKKDLSYGAIRCYRDRQKAFSKEAYCYGENFRERNIWGCKKLGLPLYEWGGGWLEYGSFDNQGGWVFDKQRIQHELLTALKSCEACPVLNKEKVLETLDALPDRVLPDKDKHWEYILRNDYKDGKLIEYATGIRPVLPKAGDLILGEYSPEWESDTVSATAFIESEEPKRSSESARNAKNTPDSNNVWLWGLLGVVLITLYMVATG